MSEQATRPSCYVRSHACGQLTKQSRELDSDLVEDPKLLGVFDLFLYKLESSSWARNKDDT